MAISKLAHFSIRTTDMEATRRFYVDVMGFREGFRPPFQFPGIWLYQGGDESDYGVVHIIGMDPDDQAGLVEYWATSHKPRSMEAARSITWPSWPRTCPACTVG